MSTALKKFVEETQEREWNRLLEAVRRGINTVCSIEVENEIDTIRESIGLVGPTAWNAVPWPIYLSGLYAQILEPEDRPTHMPNMLEHSAAVQQMREPTNANDVALCRELVDILRSRAVRSGS